MYLLIYQVVLIFLHQHLKFTHVILKINLYDHKLLKRYYIYNIVIGS
jgi:hypothetical protein